MFSIQLLRHPFVIWVFLFNLVKCIPSKVRPAINTQLGIIDSYIFENPVGSILTLICMYLGSCILLETYYNQTTIYKKLPYPATSDRENRHKAKRLQIMKKIPVYLLGSSWIYLKTLDFIIESNKVKDILGIVILLISHFLIIPMTCIYLDINDTKYYLQILGYHNIGIIILHILLPNCPPIYNHLNGDKSPSYDNPEYFEGVNLGYNYMLNIINHGLALTTIEFGILPSLHSSISIISVLFVIYSNGDRRFKVASLIYLGLVIWSGIYFKHHWKLDNLASFIYSIAWFTIFKDSIPSVKS